MIAQQFLIVPKEIDFLIYYYSIRHATNIINSYVQNMYLYICNCNPTHAVWWINGSSWPQNSIPFNPFSWPWSQFSLFIGILFILSTVYTFFLCMCFFFVSVCWIVHEIKDKVLNFLTWVVLDFCRVDEFMLVFDFSCYFKDCLL